MKKIIFYGFMTCLTVGSLIFLLGLYFMDKISGEKTEKFLIGAGQFFNPKD